MKTNINSQATIAKQVDWYPDHKLSLSKKLLLKGVFVIKIYDTSISMKYISRCLRFNLDIRMSIRTPIARVTDNAYFHAWFRISRSLG